MTDCEKVIKGLECCLSNKNPPCSECGYNGDMRYNDAWSCRLSLMADAHEILKAQEPITGETSDGYHTFNELYHHRAVLFSVIVANYPDRTWKAKKHHDGTMYDGMFIVGIETPSGQATYHYDVIPYWDRFKCRELENAPEWDGHTPAQAIERIGELAGLKAQEPRVMTLEEVISGDECWVEYPNGGCGYADCYLSYTAKGADIYRTMQHDFNVPLANYGKTWRCWTSRPTDEQREATPWN